MPITKFVMNIKFRMKARFFNLKDPIIITGLIKIFQFACITHKSLHVIYYVGVALPRNRSIRKHAE